MAKKIVSFGDSFIYGLELSNNDDGSRAWPGLIASELGYEYETLAVSGCGNENIARQIYHYFANNTVNDTLAVINWTWTQRWDFYVVQDTTAGGKWITLGPTCVPDSISEFLESQNDRKNLLNIAHNYCINSILWNKFRTLQAIANVQQYIEQKGINAIQTYTDSQMLNVDWHAPDYIQELQKMVTPHMTDWDGKTFLEWCDSQGFYKTETLHPLEPAHQAAAEFWKETYRAKLQ